MKSALTSKKGTSGSSISSSEKICSISCVLFSIFILAYIMTLAMPSFVITTMHALNNTQQQEQEQNQNQEIEQDLFNIFKNPINSTTRHTSYLKDEEQDPKKQLGFINSSLSNIYVTGEESFLKTIKSCIPPSLPINNEKWPQKATCVERKKHSNKDTINRVGILAPPGKIGDAFYTLIKEVIEHIKSTTKLQEDIIIERETHVPPYGYGKVEERKGGSNQGGDSNHGWTKVMRLLLPLKLSLGEISNGHEYAYKMMAIFRQIIRWHCRLSHFAAHTALITVNVTDFIIIDDKSFDILFDNIISFITGSSLSSEQQQIPKIINPKQTFDKSFSNLKKAMINAMQKANNVNDNIDFPSVIKNELDTTSELNEPCKSFLSFDHNNFSLLNDVQIQNISKLLSPNCDDYKVVKCTMDNKCGVEVDSSCS